VRILRKLLLVSANPKHFSFKTLLAADTYDLPCAKLLLFILFAISRPECLTHRFLAVPLHKVKKLAGENYLS
jgi:hypothetical protein